MTPARGTRALRTLLSLVALFTFPGGSTAQVTPYVPVDDPAYRDLDALVSVGLVQGMIVGQRPYSRAAFRRWAGEAALRAASHEEVPLRFQEALARLAARFGGDDAEPVWVWRGVRGDGAWSDSPPRPIPTQLKSSVDADVNPLLQRSFGRPLADGWTAGAEGWVEGRLGSHVAAQLRPRVWATHTRGAGDRLDGGLVDGYVRALVGNLAVDAGRVGVVRGFAPTAAPVLSGNARGLDQIRLSMERPARLPWILKGLGPFAFSGSVSDMGRDQDTPGSKLVVFQGSIRPHRDLELGGALLNHQGGGVGPDTPLGDRLRDVFFLLSRRPFYWWGGVNVASDKVLALDARLSMPSRGVVLALEMMTTDDHDVFRAAKQSLWNDAAWTGSAQVTGLGGQGRLDAWLQLSRVGLLPYTHHEFTSGLAVDRRILGSPLGPLGTGLEGGIHWNGNGDRISVAGAWERYSGDTYRNPDDGLSHRFRVADNPDEIRVRGTVTWTRDVGWQGMRTTLHGGVERVARFALTDAGRTNALLLFRVERTW